jgi:hypothetical protein
MNGIQSADANLILALDALLHEGSVTAAARRMNVTAPAMSHTLARLRATLGDPLFAASFAVGKPTLSAAETPKGQGGGRGPQMGSRIGGTPADDLGSTVRRRPNGSTLPSIEMSARWLCGIALLLGACSTQGGSSTGSPDGSPVEASIDATNSTTDVVSPPIDATTDATSVPADGAADASNQTDSAFDAATDAIEDQAQGAVDAGPDASPATYNDFTVTTNWSSYDVTADVDASLHSYVGGTFDGRYVYFVPNEAPNLALRYDTLGAFASPASWSTFDTESVNINAYGFMGAVFDGRYVYYIPWYSSGADSTYLARYDTTAPFTSGSSWSIVSTPIGGFQGATFDGRYIYMAKITSSAGPLVRYDTMVADAASSFSTFDMHTVDSHAYWLFGALFDGRHVYVESTSSGYIAQYDTTGMLDAGASYAFFDVGGTPLNVSGLTNGAFDGRYVYFTGRKIARYDTQASFTTAASWSAVDATTVTANGCILGGFDGRYVYFLGNGSPKITRYDTTTVFASTWPTFDTTSVGGVAQGFYGAVFDGRYLYLLPNGTGAGAHAVVLRFDAKSPPSMPPLAAFHGSFF